MSCSTSLHKTNFAGKIRQGDQIMMVNGSSMVDTTVGEAKKVLERALRDHRVGCLLSICTSVLYY